MLVGACGARVVVRERGLDGLVDVLVLVSGERLRCLHGGGPPAPWPLPRPFVCVRTRDDVGGVVLVVRGLSWGRGSPHVRQRGRSTQLLAPQARQPYSCRAVVVAEKGCEVFTPRGWRVLCSLSFSFPPKLKMASRICWAASLASGASLAFLPLRFPRVATCHAIESKQG